MENITIKIGGMHCVRCSESLQKALNNSGGIISANVSFASEKANIVYDSNVISYKEICKIVKNVGFYVVNESNKDKDFKKTLYMFMFSMILTFPFLIMMIFMFIDGLEFLHNGILQLALVTPIQFVVGYKFYKGAYDSIKNKSPNMDVLVSLGTSVAYFYSLYNLINDIHEYYFESCAFVITLVYLGKLLEMKSKNKTNEALSSLMKLRPDKVTIIKDKEYVDIDINELKEGIIFVTKMGENIASDGIIVKGSASIDESMVTGESIPKFKNKEDKVIGGTINVDGLIEVRAHHIGETSTLSKIIKLVEEAESSKAKVQKLADKVSSIFVPSIVLIAIVTFIINYLIVKDVSMSVSRAVAVLVVACPCSLGLATPTALIVGMGMSAKRGILIKNADALEKMCNVKTIVLDKTGTITTGELIVSAVDVFDGYDYKRFSNIVRKMEENSNHPLAKAIVKYFDKSEIELSKIKEVAGKGIEAIYEEEKIKIGSYNWLSKYCEGRKYNGGEVLVVINEKLVGVISLEDSVKENSSNAINKLKDNGMSIVLASGDNEEVCKRVADSVGIDRVYFEVLPEEKHKIINECRDDGFVAMVGDGINDAPALASSDVGIAMGNGLDIAIDSCDVVIMNNDLMSISTAYIISQSTMRKIKQNLFWAFFYNCVAIPLACVGLLSPIIAGLCMSLSSVSVITNSLLLNRIKV